MESNKGEKSNKTSGVWAGLWRQAPLVPPAVAPWMMLQWQGKDTNMNSMLWAGLSLISVTGKAATYLRTQPLAEAVFSAEYSCPSPCCPCHFPFYSSSKKQDPCKGTVRWEPFFPLQATRWQPFFLPSKQILWLSLKSLHCHNPSNSTTQVIWSTSSCFPESPQPS